MGKKIQIGLLGSGTVGSGVVEVLKKNVRDIEQRVGCEIGIKTVLVRDLTKKRENLDGIKITDSIDEILNDPDISIVVELMGGLHPAIEYMVKSMKAGKHVVTANKDAVAQSGEELFSAAEAEIPPAVNAEAAIAAARIALIDFFIIYSS